MKKIVFLGAKEIGKQCLQELFARQDTLDFALVAVGTSPRGQAVKEFCIQHKIPLLTDLNGLFELDFDILFSVQYHQILKPQHIFCAKEIALNLHLAPLPEYRGCNQFSFAILNEDKEFGVTIHQMDEGIDNGAIAFQKRFKIPKNCFVEELVELANTYGVELFSENLEKMIKGDYRLIPQDSIFSPRREFHKRIEIESLKHIRLASFTRRARQRCTFVQGRSVAAPSTVTGNAGRLSPYSFFSHSAVSRSRAWPVMYCWTRRLLAISPFHSWRAASMSAWVISLGGIVAGIGGVAPGI